MIILVTGSRNWTDYATIHLALTETIKNHFYPNKPKRQDVLIVHGGARGADTLAGEWAIAHNVPQKVYVPDWNNYGRSAGIRRNAEMLEKENPDVVLAFRKDMSRGTSHMIDIAQKAGKKVIIYDL